MKGITLADRLSFFKMVDIPELNVLKIALGILFSQSLNSADIDSIRFIFEEFKDHRQMLNECMAHAYLLKGATSSFDFFIKYVLNHPTNKTDWLNSSLWINTQRSQRNI